jgi:hypothetical protein
VTLLDLIPADAAPVVHFHLSGRLFLLLLIVAVPFLSTLQPTHEEELELPPRFALYASAVTVIWILAGLTVVALWIEDVPLAAIGLRGVPVAEFVGWTAFATAATLGTSFVITRIGAALGARESRLAYYLIPRTSRERWAFVAVSGSAGFCEEMVYHGYTIAGLAAWLGSGWWAALVANLAFGVLHGYQNTVGVVRAGVMGYVLSVPVIAGAGLWPGMVAHALVNLILGFGGWRWILPEGTSNDEPTTGEDRKTMP